MGTEPPHPNIGGPRGTSTPTSTHAPLVDPCLIGQTMLPRTAPPPPTHHTHPTHPHPLPTLGTIPPTTHHPPLLAMIQIMVYIHIYTHIYICEVGSPFCPVPFPHGPDSFEHVTCTHTCVHYIYIYIYTHTYGHTCYMRT